MSTKILTPWDFSKNEIQNARIQNLASAPSSPVTGQMYFDTTLGHEYVYNGSAWEQASGGGGSGSVTSVALSLPSVFTVSGSPVTSSGTLTAVFASQAASTFLASPSGSSGAIAARTIVAADLPALNAITAPTADVTLNSHKITNLLDPVSAQDAATKNYVDVTIQGLVQKPTANAATAAALSANTYSNGSSGVGATLTASSSVTLVVDGYTPVVGDLILVKNEATAANNGLYTVTACGAGAGYTLTRHVDLDQATEFKGGFIPVGNQGTANANSLWLCTNTAAPTVGTTSITFTQLNGATDLTAGTGITISGNTISVATSYAGGSSIVTVGTITTGTWNGTTIAITNGGTGATTAAGARSNLSATGKYSALVGDGSATSYAITQATHGLASNGQMNVQLFDASSGNQVYCDVSINNSNGTITLTFATAPASNAYRVVVVG